MQEEVRPKRVCGPKYAIQKVKKGKTLNRWEREELAKDPELSLKYAQLTRQRFPEAEPEIARRSDLALQYAHKVIGGRFPEAEEALVYKTQNFYNGQDVVRNYFIMYGVRNEKIESYIIERDQSLAGDYAKECLKGRWEAAEKALLKGRLDNAVEYQKEVLADRWPEFEKRILFGKGISYWESPVDCFKKYLKNIGHRHPDIEESLMKSSKASMILAYAVVACRGRLPKALHQKMMMFSFDPKRQKYAKKYLKFLEQTEKKVVGYLAGLEEDERMEVLEKARTN